MVHLLTSRQGNPFLRQEKTSGERRSEEKGALMDGNSLDEELKLRPCRGDTGRAKADEDIGIVLEPALFQGTSHGQWYGCRDGIPKEFVGVVTLFLAQFARLDHLFTHGITGSMAENDLMGETFQGGVVPVVLT